MCAGQRFAVASVIIFDHFRKTHILNENKPVLKHLIHLEDILKMEKHKSKKITSAAGFVLNEKNLFLEKLC